MGDNEYKISLGVDLSTAGLKEEINKLDDKYKIKLGVDLKVNDIRDRITQYNKNSNNAKLKLGVKLDTDDLKRQINSLNLSGKSGGKGVAIPLNTASLETSLREVKSIITDIKNSIGSLDSGAGMKSLLSSINQISTALDKASGKFDELNTELKILSSKDFNINVGINTGGSNPVARNAAYGNKVRNETLPQLKQQAEALESYLKQYYKVADGFNAAQKLLQGTNAGDGKANLYDLLPKMLDTTGSLSGQMTAWKEYIALMKEAASIKGIDISGVLSQFSKQSDELVKDAQDVQTGAKEMQDAFKGLFGGSGIDAEGLTAQLNSIVSDLGEVKTTIQELSSGVSIDRLTASFDRLSESIELLVKNCTVAKQVINDSIGNGLNGSTGGADSGVKNLNNDLKQATVTAENTADAIQNIQGVMSSMKFNDSSIDAVTKDLEELGIEISKISVKDNGVNLDVTVKGIDTVGRAVTEVRRLDKATEKISPISTTITQSFDKGAEAAKRFKKEADIKFNFETDKYYNQISQLDDNFNKLSSASKDLRASFEQVHNAYKELEFAYDGTGDEVADRERLIQAEKKYAEALERTNNLIKVQARTERADANSLKLKEDIKLFQADVDKWLINNSAATKRFGGTMLDLKAKAEGVDRVTLNGLIRQFKLADKEAEKLGLKTQSVGDKIKTKFKEYASYLSAAELFMYAEQGLRSMFEQVKLIDSAMTELKKVTDESDATYNEFLTNAASKAKDIGTTIDGLVSSTADFARLGYGFGDAQGLAEVANIYAVVGDEIEGVEGATQSLISTIAAFKDEMNGLSDSDFALSIVDKLNEVANNYSISSGGLGEALQRSASSLATGNNTLDESISLITAANEVVQNPEKVGNAMKTISMRIRSAKSEMEEMGENTDGMVESTATLRAEIKALSGVDIMASATEFKSTYQILDELSKKWEDLSDITQATIIEKMAGKHQGNIFSSLMENFDTARNALETSMNSTGSAMAEHEKWSQSLEAQLLKLQASWQGLSQAFLSSDFLKVALDGVIGLVDGVAKLIDTLGALPTLIGTFAGGLSLFKNTGLFTFDKDVQSVKLLGNGLKDLNNKYSQTKAAIDRYNSVSSKSVSFQEKYNKAMAGSSTSMGKYLSGLKGAKASFGGYITSLVGATIKTVALEAATVAMNTALTMGVSFLISVAISAISKWINAEEELAEKVSEVTSKFKEQHNELKKLQSDYDASNESSMVSKYGELSKGVDGLGRNISLTADEYAEYQDIVSTIAEQIPSLVSGYDSQGNAILSCKGNVEELTEAYEKLIHAQNQEILTNTGDIEKDFANTLKDASGKGNWSDGHGFWAKFDWFGLKDYELKSDSVEVLENLLSASNKEERSKLIKEAATSGDIYSERELRDALEKSGFDVKYSESAYEVLEEALETDPSKIKGIVDDSYTQFADAIEEQKTIATAKLSEAFDISSSISGLNYGNISEELQAIAYQTVNSLDFDFLSKLSKDGKSVEDWTTEMLDQLKTIGKDDNAEIEAGFELQTKFNGGEISYGEYVDGLRNLKTTIDGLDLKDEVKEQLKISVGLDDNNAVEQYDALKNRLSHKYKGDTLKSVGNSQRLNSVDMKLLTEEAEEKAESFLDSLTSTEYAVAIDLIANEEIDLNNFNIDSLRDYIKKEAMLQDALNFTIAMDVETESIEALNTAMSESVSGVGLSSEAIAALKGRYADLASEGYDLSAMFEETSNGIHLNRRAVNELEQAYAKNKLTETRGNIDVLKDRYDELTNEINNCSDASERASLYREQQTIVQKINDLGTLAAQYEGLASSYNAWLSAEESGQERDMYEQVIEGFENIGDEISRGWYDDGTIKFLELVTGETDLAGKSASELKKTWKDLDKDIENTSYSVKDFFTVDEDGNSTSAGVYNFLRAIQELEGHKDVFKDVKGNIKDLVEIEDGKVVGFNFDIVGGDEAIAEALGISEELVQIMLRAADDAGFVVTLDGNWTQFADLKDQAEKANDAIKNLAQSNEKLKEAGFGEYEFNFGADTIDEINAELDKAKELLNSDAFKNPKTGKFDLSIDGAGKALKIAETLLITKQQLEEPAYMSIKVEELQTELQEPVELLQKFEDKAQRIELLSLTPDINAKEIKTLDTELNTIAESLYNIKNEDVKVKLGIKGKTPEQIREELENGTIEVPTELTIEANMDKSLEDLVTLGLFEQGLISERDARIRLNLEVETEKVDTSAIEEELEKTELTEDQKINILAVAEVLGVEDVDTLSERLSSLDDEHIQVLAEVLGKIDVEKLKETIYGLDDKTVQAIAEAFGEGDVDSLKTTINGLDDKTVQAIAEAFGYSSVKELNTAIEGMDDKTVQAIAQALGITDVDSLRNAVNRLDDKNVKAAATATGKGEVDSLNSSLDTLKKKDGTKITITTFLDTVKRVFNQVASGGQSKADQRTGADPDGGTMKGAVGVNGTTGKAFKQGSWGTKNSGTALVGELGREVLVRDGKYYTIGDNGAEFIKYKKGDIIFNHVQSEELFRNGKVTAGGGRAKALVGGTAFLEGTAFSEGINGGEEPDVTSYSVGSKSKSSSKSSKEFEETFDWVEVAISRVERAIDQLDQKANNIYKSWATRNAALTSQIGKVGEAIDVQQKAYDKYMSKANSVGLSSSWVKKIQNGAFDISTVTDEDLADKIKEYQDWYEKALDCKDAIEELKETEASLYAKRVENAAAEYEGILGVIEHEKNMIEEYISQSEANAMLVSGKYYEALMDNERETIAELENQRAEMLDAFNTAMDSGTIDKNSEAYYDMVNSIDEVTLAIEESNTALEEWEQTLQQIDWELFDILQERISGVAEEADFLIELMNNSKLFDDKGQLTDKGSATMGLHGQNYNVYMNQADRYREEVAELNKELAKDPYDQDLVNRRDELLELQRESILAAEDEKEAIRDMVEEGIEFELDALQELIDKKNEQLESEKDLYDYQKKVKEQTKEIASLEKQLAAYSGDDSEEARQKIQQIKVDLESAKSDLEETEYDKYIDDSAALLDNLYLEYETILNSRMDNLDALIADMIAEINADAGIIGETITNAASDVGYTLSDSLKTIWMESSVGSNAVITTYGDKFVNAQTTTNTALNNIYTSLQNMMSYLNKSATTKVKTATTSSASKSPKQPTSNANKTNVTKNPTSGGDGTPKIGDRVKFVSGQYYYDSQGKKPLGSQKQGQYVYITNINKRDWATHPYHISTGKTLGKGDLGWLKLNQISGYATGKNNFSNNEIAWTQEDGQEYIIRPSDGAILTPIAKGDSVLTSAASNNIWDMANSPAEFIKNNLGLDGANIPSSANFNNKVTQNFENITFSLPNVRNYEQLVSEMQRDPKFEKLILAMTVDQIAGKSKLTKGKAIR